MLVSGCRTRARMAPGAHPGPPVRHRELVPGTNGAPLGRCISCPAGAGPPPGGHRAGRAHGAWRAGSLAGAVECTPAPCPSQPEAPVCGGGSWVGVFPKLGGSHRPWLPGLGCSPRTRSCSWTMGLESGLPGAPWGWGGEGRAPGVGGGWSSGAVPGGHHPRLSAGVCVWKIPQPKVSKDGLHAKGGKWEAASRGVPEGLTIPWPSSTAHAKGSPKPPAPVTRTHSPRAPSLAAHSPGNVCSGRAARHLREGTRGTQGGQQRAGERSRIGSGLGPQPWEVFLR